MATLKPRHNRFEARVRIPKDMVAAYGGRELLYKTLQTSDLRAAKIEAAAWEAMLRAEWAEKMGHDSPGLARVRAIYERVKVEAVSGGFMVEGADEAPALAGIDHELGKLADALAPSQELTDTQAARVAALNDARKVLQGKAAAPRPEYEPAFSEVAADFIKHWKAEGTKKPSNTEQQKRATFDLFRRFWNDRPMRGIRQTNAATFHDALRLLDPHWPRTEEGRGLSWNALLVRFGNRPKGLSQSTINRHVDGLKSLWTWAARRGHCSGDNPFDGFRRKVRPGVNASPYVAWETAELNALLAAPAPRRDLTELILVGMFTAMRIDEIASLTWGQLQVRDGVSYFEVIDAKTPAGNRQVPVHPMLSWLLQRERTTDDARIWPGWNLEGPGKRAGSDASRDFSRFKADRGFTSRTKVFHSFRKNVTRLMEQAGVSENDWAQVFGHERGFTYRTYNADGITLERKAGLINMIEYPGVVLPEISAEAVPPRRPQIRRKITAKR